MADHINIHHPDIRERHDSERKRIAQLEAENRRLEALVMSLRSDLDAIFTRIRRGDRVELHYPDGEVIEAAKAGVARDR